MYLREPPSKRQRIGPGWDDPLDDDWGGPSRKEGWARPEEPGWGPRPEEAEWNRRRGRGMRRRGFRGYGPERGYLRGPDRDLFSGPGPDRGLERGPPRGGDMGPDRDWGRRPRDMGRRPRDLDVRGRGGPRPGRGGPRPGPRQERPPQKPFIENKQLLNGNYRGALQEHLQRETGRPVNIIFNTDRIPHGKQEESIYTSRCVVKGIHGEGYGATRKEAVQLAALDIIVKMELATEQEIEEVKSGFTGEKAQGIGGKEEVKDIKDLPPLVENPSYLNGNYRGALQEYFQKAKIRAQLTYHTRDEMSGDAKVFITTCKASGGKFEDGVGHASTKKAAVHFASLDFMLKIGLLTMEEHLEKHPG